MGPVTDNQAREEESVLERRDALEAPTAAPSLNSAASVLALQRAAGNRAVARLVAERHGRTATDVRPAPPLRAPEQSVQRGFWSKLWGGVKKVASTVGNAVVGAAKTVGHAVETGAKAVAHAVEGAASWVWDHAKKAGQWAVDWLGRASKAVLRAIEWFGAGAWDIIKQVGTRAFELLAALPMAAWDFVRFLPIRLVRLAIDSWDAIWGALTWVYRGFANGFSWAWFMDGCKRALWWLIGTAVHVVEAMGLPEAIKVLTPIFFATRPLNQDERDASKNTHGPGQIPYDEVRVDLGSWAVKLGQWINIKAGDPNASARPFTLFHVIHADSTLAVDVAVHELTHVAQYEKHGANYIPQALHNQGPNNEGYKYGDLIKARAEGRHFKDFNPESQAQMVQDFYRLKNHMTAEMGGTLAGLEPFIQEMKAGLY